MTHPDETKDTNDQCAESNRNWTDDEVLIAEALAALESDATTEQREEAFDKLRDRWFPQRTVPKDTLKSPPPSVERAKEPRVLAGDITHALQSQALIFSANCQRIEDVITDMLTSVPRPAPPREDER